MKCGERAMGKNLCLVGLLFVFSILVTPISASAIPINASPAEIEKWLENEIWEKDGIDLDLYLSGKIEFGEDNKIADVYDPDCDWVYAVVKYGKNFEIVPNKDGLLYTSDLTKDVSNVTFFAPVAPVPEPATILLIASGLIGLAAFRRKFKRG